MRHRNPFLLIQKKRKESLVTMCVVTTPGADLGRPGRHMLQQPQQAYEAFYLMDLAC